MSADSFRSPGSLKLQDLSLTERLVELETIRDQVLAYYKRLEDHDPRSATMFRSDLYEAYYAAVTEKQRQTSSSPTESKGGADGCAYLQSRLECVSSELRGRRDPEAQALLQEWEAVGVQVWALLKAGAERLRSQDAALQLSLANPHLVRQMQVMHTGAERYELYCSLCGNQAASFEVGESLVQHQKALLYKGLVCKQSLKLRLAAEVLGLLAAGNVGAVHRLLITSNECHEGVDAWCPECEAVYCRSHYSCIDEYDEGFYESTRATCPRGHSRRVAD